MRTFNITFKDPNIEDTKEMMRETLRKAGIDYLEASITYGDFEIREN